MSWVLKYGVDTIEAFIGDDEVKHRVNYWLHNNQFPHVTTIISGSGYGKTTYAKLIAGRLSSWHIYYSMSSPIYADDWQNDMSVVIIDDLMYATDSKWGQLKHLINTHKPEHIIVVSESVQHLPSFLKHQAIPIHLRRPTRDEVKTYVKHITDALEVDVQDETLHYIINQHDNRLGQSLDFIEHHVENGRVRFDSIRATLGNVSDTLLGNYMKAIKKRDMTDSIRFARELTQDGTDVPRIIENIEQFLKRLIYVQNGIELDTFTEQDVLNMKSVAKGITTDQLAQMLGIVTRNTDLIVLTTELLDVFKPMPDIINWLDTLYETREEWMNKLNEAPVQNGDEAEFSQVTDKVNEKSKKPTEETNTRINDGGLADIFGRNVRVFND